MAAAGIVFDEMSGTEVLDTVEVLAGRVRHTELELLRAAAEWAAINGQGSVDPDKARLPGRESLRHYGGPGTPYVASFAGATLGARLGKSTHAGEQMIATVLDLQHRLPQLWARVQAFEVEVSYARHVTRRTRDLSVGEAAYVDSRVTESADGRISWTQFETLVEAAIVAANPDAAREREEAARRSRFAKTTRSTSEGMRGFYLRTDTAGITRLDATVAYLAEALRALGCDEPEDHRRAMAMVMLANPAHTTRFLAHYATWKQRPQDPPAPAPDEDRDTDAEDHNTGPADTTGTASDSTRGGGGDSPGTDDTQHSDPGTAGESTTTDGQGTSDGGRPAPTGIIGDALDLYVQGGGQPDGTRPVIDWDQLLPTVNIYLHLYGGTLTTRPDGTLGLTPHDATGVARLEGIDPLTDTWARETLGNQARFVIRPVLDPTNMAPVHAWEIPDRHRQAVCLLTPADEFPYSTATINQTDGWTAMQIDHTIPWRPDDPGGSRIGNYGPLTTFHHHIKTHGRWKVAQPFPGIYLWRDPHHATYLVDHTGTRRLTTPVQIDLVDYDPHAAA